jgi:hypothetical protein
VKLSLVQRVRLAGRTMIAGFGLTMEAFGTRIREGGSLAKAFGLVLVFDWIGVLLEAVSWGQGQL